MKSAEKIWNSAKVDDQSPEPTTLRGRTLGICKKPPMFTHNASPRGQYHGQT